MPQDDSWKGTKEDGVGVFYGMLLRVMCVCGLYDFNADSVRVA